MTLGLDLTESVIRAAVVDDAGVIVAREEHTASGGGIAAATREVVQQVRAGSGNTVACAGYATASIGEQPPSDIANAISDAFPGVNASHVEAGAATALAELWCGAARGGKNVVTFSVGEKVTAGIILNGAVYTGTHGFAGSVSWLALNPVEREDYRKWGGLQAEVASAGIVRRLVWRVKSGDHSALVDQVNGDLTRITADMIFRGARTGDGVCVSVVRDTAKYVAMAVANLATVLDPEIIVLGGALAGSGAMMLDAIRVDCARRLSPAQGERVRIVLSTLGADAVAIGAARAATLRR